MKLNIYAPGLTQLCRQASMPMQYLEKLLERSEKKPMVQGWQVLLCQQLALPFTQTLPYAELTARVDGLAADHWLRADPVNLLIDLADIYMNGQKGMLITAEEMLSLAKTLQPVFATRNLQLQMPHPLRWYVGLPAATAFVGRSHQSIMGQSIRSYLATMNETQWLQLFTELQMVLHDAPVNASRIQLRQPEIDALWFFGAGQLPKNPPDLAETLFVSDAAVIKGLAQWLNQPYLHLELTEFSNIMAGSKENVTIVLAKLLSYELTDEMIMLDKLFFRPLYQLASRNKIYLTLIDEESCYIVKPSVLINIWHKFVKR